MYTKEQRTQLLRLARETLEHRLSGKPLPVVAVTDPALLEKRGVFVTLHQGGMLRGCIGSILPREPLWLAVRNMAVEAATGDPRFPPVTAGELAGTRLEISVLTVPLRVRDAGEIVMGRDGVIVRRGPHAGVFLPQVADETGWSREEFLGNLCAHKAGLPSDAWKDPATALETFQAEVFSEGEP